MNTWQILVGSLAGDLAPYLPPGTKHAPRCTEALERHDPVRIEQDAARKEREARRVSASCTQYLDAIRSAGQPVSTREIAVMMNKNRADGWMDKILKMLVADGRLEVKVGETVWKTKIFRYKIAKEKK